MYLDVDVRAHSDEDGPDEEEEEVEDGDELVEHAVAAVVHLGGFSCSSHSEIQHVERSTILSLRACRLNFSKNSMTHGKGALNGGVTDRALTKIHNLGTAHKN